MEGLKVFLQSANLILLIVLMIMMVLSFMILSQLNGKLNRLRRRYDLLLRGRGELDFEGLIAAHSQDIEENKTEIDVVKKEVEQSLKEMKERVSEFDRLTTHSLQKVGFYRYNAFDEVTNEMSYSVAMLDYNDTGLIFTSIFGRSSSATYAKQIRKGKSSVELSEEEKIALGKAINGL